MKNAFLMLVAAALLPGGALARTVNGGGTNYALYSMGDNDPTNNCRFFLPALNVRPIVGTYHRDRSTVNNHIAKMRQSGQTDWSLVIFFDDLTSDPDGNNDGVWGHLVSSANGRLSSQHAQNLTDILTEVKKADATTGKKFRRVIVRFATQGGSDLTEWKDANGNFIWDEVKYQRNWNFIANTRTQVSNALAGSGIEVLFDLGVELAGVKFSAGDKYYTLNPIWEEYLRHLYGDYVTTYGAGDTLGFSFVGEGWRVTNMAAWYEKWNGLYGWPIPKHWAVDLYDNTSRTREVSAVNCNASSPTVTYSPFSGPKTDIYTKLREVYGALGFRDGQPIIILETDFNDASVAASVRTALLDTTTMPNLNLDGLFQWQHLRLREKDINFSQDAIIQLSTVNSFAAYTTGSPTILGARVARIFNDHTGRLALNDVNCGSSPVGTGVCSVNYKTGAAPSGNYVVRVTSSAGVGVVSCGAAPHNDTPNWIQPNIEYSFELFQVGSGCTVPAGAVPVSTSTVLVK